MSPSDDKPTYGIRGRKLGDIEVVELCWVLYGVIVQNAVNMFTGSGGTGKTLMALYMLGLISRGQLEGALFGRPTKVGIIALEDPLDAVTSPRLRAVNADLELTFMMEGTVTSADGSVTHERPLRIPHDVPEIEKFVRDNGIKVLLLDSWSRLLVGDTNKGTDVASAIGELKSICDRHGVTIIIIHHSNKNVFAKGQARVSGSTQNTDAVRHQVEFAYDEEAGHYVYQAHKANYLPMADKKPRAYTIETTKLVLPSGNETEVPHIVMLDNVVAADLNDVIVRNAGERPDSGSRASCKEWLRMYFDTLKDKGGEATSREVYKAAKAAANFSESTVQRAYKDMGGASVWGSRDGKTVSIWPDPDAKPTRSLTTVDRLDRVDKTAGQTHSVNSVTTDTVTTLDRVPKTHETRGEGDKKPKPRKATKTELEAAALAANNTPLPLEGISA